MSRLQSLVCLLLPALTASFVLNAPSSPSTTVQGVETLKELAESNGDFLGKSIGYWDPFKLGEEGDFWGLGNEATIGYLRHAEIKHGRVAMAAFLGYCVQSLPIVSGPHVFDPYRGYVAGVTPQEQWDNIPAIAKFQILVFIGMLESYGEGAGSPEGYVHYTKGGLPGYFPPIAGGGGGQISFNLFKPQFIEPFFPVQSDAEKARGRQVEINNGRLAQIGILSLLSESATPGSVPGLTVLDSLLAPFGLGIQPYDGDAVAGFANIYSQFNIFS
eukprot:CAMPEP_0118897042 /NCGR_PEP_ID=MMETSP1166-20130328/4606_1 /TAXON_ID=1104430 /ORGANISM="Chrysoreinhardia sp, Strain CCMP3193" /LENGTH=272 /DNA_ID=CAMNT_0006836103 /DNA_START=43 /DNA_END=861 /DNA_ORIENTATION=+